MFYDLIDSGVEVDTLNHDSTAWRLSDIIDAVKSIAEDDRADIRDFCYALYSNNNNQFSTADYFMFAKHGTIDGKVKEIFINSPRFVNNPFPNPFKASSIICFVFQSLSACLW